MRVILGSCFTVLLATIAGAVDRDDHPDSATGFVNHEHVPWTDYHDPDGALQAFASTGFPFQVLIDPEGKVTFAGGSMSKLRAAITTKRLPGWFAIQGTCVAGNQWISAGSPWL